MFIYNIKVNGTRIFKIFLSIVIILIIGIIGVVFYRVFAGAINHNREYVDSNSVFKIESKNYTNVLKAVHDNIDNYVGTKFSFTGYVYRVFDLKDNQFILARNMIISSDFQYVVVGFLCEYEKAKELPNDSWVEITGEITKGDYHGDMPIVKILNVNTTTKPNEELVYPPEQSYIPTSGVL